MILTLLCGTASAEQNVPGCNVYCTVCNYVQKRSYVSPATGHFPAANPGYAPTCTEDVPFAFTAAYISGGKVVPFTGDDTISLPVDAEKVSGCKLVRIDVTPATETEERKDAWTELKYSFEEGVLSFETDAAGLYLLIPNNA